jgi:hypothetical protein
LRAYRDPNTGVFGEPPAGAAPAARAAAPAAMTEMAAPGGGRMIRLNGAFRSQMVGRLDGNTGNTATVSCASTGRVPGEAKPAVAR